MIFITLAYSNEKATFANPLTYRNALTIIQHRKCY